MLTDSNFSGFTQKEVLVTFEGAMQLEVNVVYLKRKNSDLINVSDITEHQVNN